ncbi:F510_1955 family glycosylhydrolase [Streptomyces sp. NPDC093111]|uniref:F510_1955 family glycosylhydrolase n=1 Tax=Streptomyces sp. NPDC093111 TaxID=3154978 RepID=UPI0034388784
MKKHRAALAAALTTALALALTACGSDEAPGSKAGSGAATALSHIHGVGTAGGKLYVATHEGVYTPGADGRPALVGDRKDDFMGFTVTPQGAFLASGHPAPGTDGPSNLGLISSTDKGTSWTTRSLAGEVDFHSLDTSADATVYGYDSTNGRLRVSRDGVAWEDRAALGALDIAVAPATPGTVLATTERGVVRSTDDGRTFGRPLSGQLVAYVSWGAPDALFGVDPEGVLLRSADAGATWSRVSTVPGGAPQALTAVDARRLLAATQDGVYESVDGGRSFTRRMAVTSGGDGH